MKKSVIIQFLILSLFHPCIEAQNCIPGDLYYIETDPSFEGVPCDVFDVNACEIFPEVTPGTATRCETIHIDLTSDLLCGLFPENRTDCDGTVIITSTLTNLDGSPVPVNSCGGYDVQNGECYNYCTTVTYTTFSSVAKLCLSPKVVPANLEIIHYYELPPGEGYLLFDSYYPNIRPKQYRVSTDETVSAFILYFSENNTNYCNHLFPSWDFKLVLNGEPLVEDDPAIIERYGKIISEVSNDSSATIIYQHPAYKLTPYSEVMIMAYDKQTGEIISEYDAAWKIDFFTPPVLMVHGLWGEPASFDDLYSELLATPWYEEFQLTKCNYKPTNSNYFSDNKKIIYKYIYGIDEKRVLEKMFRQNIAAGTVDIIAHSMGGILVRNHLKDYNNHGIRRLITVNTPHAGSQLANFLLDPDLQENNESGCEFMRALEKSCDSGAINDLQVNSEEIKMLNDSFENIVPSHAIATYVDYFGNSPIYNLGVPLGYIAKRMNLTVPILISLFNFQPNDGIVALASQTGGMSASTVFENINHTEVTENEAVIERIKDLLEESPKSDHFSKSGFNPILQQYSSPTVLQGQDNQIYVVPNHAILEVGETLILNVNEIFNLRSSTNQISEFHVFFQNGSTDNDFEFNRIGSNQGTASFQISSDPLGIRKYFVAGLDANGDILSTSVGEIFVTSSEVPSRIELIPSRFNLDIGEIEGFEVRGYFNGYDSDITYVSTLSATPLSEEGGNVAISFGSIEGQCPGEIDILVEYKGIQYQPQEPSNVIDDGSFTTPNEWIGSDGFWNNPSNWSKGRIPLPCDRVYIDSSSTVIIPSDQCPWIRELQVEKGGILYTEDGSCLTVDENGKFTAKVQP